MVLHNVASNFKRDTKGGPEGIVNVLVHYIVGAGFGSRSISLL